MKKLENFYPRKALGQNFLTNPQIVEKIIAAAELKGDETVVEVGPGFGILTEALLSHAKKVIAIEKDDRLIMSLRGRFSGRGNLELIHADALTIPPPNEKYFWIANIPYSITSPLLDHFIRDAAANGQRLPLRAVLLVQKEVAEKLCAKPPHMNVLALHVQTFGIPRKMFAVSRGNFRPQPKVDSAVVRIDFPLSLRGRSPKQSGAKAPSRASGEGSIFEHKKYFDLIHRAFSHKRKMLRATLPQELLKKAGIDETRRPETLTIEEWLTLAE